MVDHPNLRLTNAIGDLDKNNSYGAVGGLAWSEDGAMLAASVDFGGGDIRIWKRDGTFVRRLSRRTDYIGKSLAFVNDDLLLITAPADRKREDVVFSGLNATAGNIELTAVGPFKEGPLRLNAADRFVLSPDRKVLAVKTAPRKTQPIKLYRAPDWTEPQVLEGSATRFSDAVTSMAFSHDGRLIALGRIGGDILIYDVMQGQIRQKVIAFPAGEETSVESLAFTDDDSRLIVGAGIATVLPLTADRQYSPKQGTPTLVAVRDPVKVFDLASGRCEAALSGLQQPIWNIQSNGFNTAVVIMDGRRKAYEWRSDTQGPPVSIPGIGQDLYDIAFSPNGQTLAVAGANQILFFAHIN